MEFEAIYDQIDTLLRSQELKFVYDGENQEFHIGYLLNHYYETVELFIAIEKQVVVIDGFLSLNPDEEERIELIRLCNKINTHAIYGNFFVDEDDNFCIRNILTCKERLDLEELQDLMESEVFAFDFFSKAIHSIEVEGDS